MSIGSRIASRRKELNMTQGELAEALNVSFQAVSFWEHDRYCPDTDRLAGIAKALDTRVSWLMEEEGVEPGRWELKDAIFSVEHMEKFVRTNARALGMKESLKALRLMKKYHAGQFRKGKDKVPYIIHPLMLACHAFALDIATDNLIAACLLHDVLEDSEAGREDLDVNDTILDAVELVTFTEIPGLSYEESMKKYYDGIGKNRLASMVKLLDRCNNVSTMATGFTRKKIAEYIDETEKYVLPILDIVKHEYDEYYNASFLLKYQMLSVLETLKRTI